jgi:hypothetical protein
MRSVDLLCCDVPDACVFTQRQLRHTILRLSLLKLQCMHVHFLMYGLLLFGDVLLSDCDSSAVSAESAESAPLVEEMRSEAPAVSMLSRSRPLLLADR